MKVLDYRTKKKPKRNLHKLASDVSDLFRLLVNGQRAVSIYIKQVLADQVLVVDESWTADNLKSKGLFLFAFVSHLCEVVAQVYEGVEAGDDGDEVDKEGEEAAEEGEDKSMPCTLSA